MTGVLAHDLLDGTDLRREPIEVRKATLASILRKSRHGVRLNEHLDHPEGHIVFQHACKMGLEGIVSKRKDSPYRSGRSPDWLKMKNPACAAFIPDHRDAMPSRDGEGDVEKNLSFFFIKEIHPRERERRPRTGNS